MEKLDNIVSFIQRKPMHTLMLILLIVGIVREFADYQQNSASFWFFTKNTSVITKAEKKEVPYRQIPPTGENVKVFDPTYFAPYTEVKISPEDFIQKHFFWKITGPEMVMLFKAKVKK